MGLKKAEFLDLDDRDEDLGNFIERSTMQGKNSNYQAIMPDAQKRIADNLN